MGAGIRHTFSRVRGRMCRRTMMEINVASFADMTGLHRWNPVPSGTPRNGQRFLLSEV
jgi:hypothetical protein